MSQNPQWRPQAAYHHPGSSPAPVPHRGSPSSASAFHPGTAAHSQQHPPEPSRPAAALEDSPTTGRSYQPYHHQHPHRSSSYAYTPPGALPSPAFRAQRSPPPPSPLSTHHKPASSPASPTQWHDSSFQSLDAQTTSIEPETTFYTDSSAPPSPEPPSPSARLDRIANDAPDARNPLSPTAVGSTKHPSAPMAGPVAAAQGEAAKGFPRNSSIDSAISAISSKSQSTTNDGQSTPDIANLIKTAGSPEAVIQYLLKEKQSQSQQNSQLWRLVDKQRAMILGLNKDLERALKDKEKYRSKFKEVVANAAAVPKPNAPQAQRPLNTQHLPRVDVQSPRGRTAFDPDSPTLESDHNKSSSPVQIDMAPYPITPPADLAPVQPSAVRQALDPAHAMPKPQEHALGQYDHEEYDREEDKKRKDQTDASLQDIPFNAALPPSRSLPSIPPNVPPSAPPAGQPTLAVVEATPDPNGDVSQFPAPPPRKAPPAPLNLRPNLGQPPEQDDSDSEYEDLLDVDHIALGKRGRRRTRAEDDRVREVLAQKEAEVRNASKKSKASKPDSPEEELPQDSTAASHTQYSEAGAASLDAVMHGTSGDATVTSELIVPPAIQAGLPASPRPMGMANMASPPLSPRGVPQQLQNGPLSPRPPRQPIPLPPNTPLATPGSKLLSSLKSPKQNTLKKANPDDPQSDNGPTASASPTERTKIFEGLVTEDYPDLLLPPNALPSVVIQVASSRMKPSRASVMSLTQMEEDPVFTLAVISRADEGELWRVEKDSASLSRLDTRLKQCPTFTAKAPDRSLFSGHSPAKLDARRVALDQYMEELLNTPLDTPTAVEVCRYLSTNALPPNGGDSLPESAGLEGMVNKTGPEGLPYRSGYLTKKGKLYGGWKARFFVLDGPQLKYFETPGGAHLGTIKLPRAQIGKQSSASQGKGDQSPMPGGSAEDLDNQYRHAFLVLEPKKKDSNSHVKHVLCAESDKERDSWVEALLQWIDFREPEEENAKSKSHPHERQAAAAAERASGKTKKSSSNKSNGHHQSDSDTLVGVRYDSTHAGETPQGAPSRGAGPEPAQPTQFSDTMSSQKTISGPKDGQVISDTAAWGNKASGLAAPSHDEKKARKRSFFGFGPKTRTSSDGQDGFLGGETGATSRNAYPEPVRQAFGAPLAEAVRYTPPSDTDVPLPAVVFRCIQFLDARNAVLEEGIFRLSGSNVVIKQLRERFNTEGDVNLLTDDQFYDMHAVASLLKLFLRELPTTILTRDLHREFVTATEMTSKPEKLAALSVLVERLPQANATLLKYLIAFLIKIINNADVNKMTVRNVGIVFSPTLNIPAPVFAALLQNYEEIFGIDPDEYELPSPVAEDGEGPGHAELRGPRFDPPQRPATSSGSASPHRQPRIDAVSGYQRSTPTPPLASFSQGARQSPSSAGGARTGHDQDYTSQQPQPGGRSGRTGYEAGYGASSGGDFDPRSGSSQSHGPGDGSGGLAPYDHLHGSSGSGSSRRRESAIYMGGLQGLQHQGSRSRLREETPF